jgi:hypothetical protein
MSTNNPLSSGKGSAKVSPIQTTFNPNTGAIPGSRILKNIVNFFAATPVNKNGTNAAAAVRGTGQGIVNGSQSQGKKPGPTPPPDGPTLPSFHKASEMKFNLPPHEWSLPRSFSNLNNISNPNPKAVDHSLRRAMMWYYDSSDAVGGTQLQIPAGSNVSTAATGTTSAAITVEDNYWGFQFLWNPENLQNVLTRNSNVVPSVMDKFANQGGLFTAMEGLQFTIVIDRRNDFACFRGTSNPSSYSGFYTAAGTAGALGRDYGPMIDDLMRLGTMADVEYIYRMINGSGQQGRPWINALGRKTADLAFLAPTAIALQFGPSTDNSLSYVGWIESLNVNHTAFTSDMIPIHTDVQVTFNAFSRVALGSKS